MLQEGDQGVKLKAFKVQPPAPAFPWFKIPGPTSMQLTIDFDPEVADVTSIVDFLDFAGS